MRSPTLIRKVSCTAISGRQVLKFAGRVERFDQSGNYLAVRHGTEIAIYRVEHGREHVAVRIPDSSNDGVTGAVLDPRGRLLAGLGAARASRMEDGGSAQP